MSTSITPVYEAQRPPDVLPPAHGESTDTLAVGELVGCEQRNGHTRWQKITATLATLACLTGGAVYAVQVQPTSASVIYASFAGAAVAALVALVSGNVGEHKALGSLLNVFAPKADK